MAGVLSERERVDESKHPLVGRQVEKDGERYEITQIYKDSSAKPIHGPRSLVVWVPVVMFMNVDNEADLRYGPISISDGLEDILDRFRKNGYLVMDE